LLATTTPFAFLPRSATDAVAGVHGRIPAGRAGAQVSAPVAISGTGGPRERLAVPVGAVEAAQVGSFSEPVLVTKNDMPSRCDCMLAHAPSASATAATREMRVLVFISLLL